MSENKPLKTRTHAGLCLELLDDDHKLLLRELAFLLKRTALLTHGDIKFEFQGSVKRRCGACGAVSTDSLPDYERASFDDLQLVHRVDCAAEHASRLLETDPALSLLATLELASPLTPSGKAYQQVRDEMSASAAASRNLQEVAP